MDVVMRRMAHSESLGETTCSSTDHLLLRKGCNNMKTKTLQLPIESGDLESLKSALAENSELANQTVEWFLNQKNESDPLHYVCDCVFNDLLTECRAAKVATLLLESGASIEGSNGRESPLVAATSLGVESVARILIESGADVEATSIFGSRPLHWAASVGLPRIVDLLIQHGANIEAKCTEFGATPLFWAAHSVGPHGPNKPRDPVGAARALVVAGADIKTTNRYGVSALECAQDAESSEMYELLLEHS